MSEQEQDIPPSAVDEWRESRIRAIEIRFSHLIDAALELHQGTAALTKARYHQLAAIEKEVLGMTLAAASALADLQMGLVGVQDLTAFAPTSWLASKISLFEVSEPV